MRQFLFLFLQFFSFKSFSQEKTLSILENIFSKEVCNCFSRNNLKKTFDENIWNTCFRNSMMSHQKLIIETAKYVYGDTSSNTGHKLGIVLNQLVSSKLVYECDIFYNALLGDRKAYLSKHYNLNQDSIKYSIEKLNRVSLKLRNADYYNIRGGTYFELHNFNKALDDLDSANFLDNHSIISDFYKSQIAELSGNFTEAINYYEIFARKSNMPLFHLYANMLRRKYNIR